MINMRANPTPDEEYTSRLPLRSRLLRALFALIWRVLFRVRVVGKESLTGHNCIVVANHLSWIDHLLLWTILPPEPRLYLVGASQSVSSPFKAWLLRNFGGVIAFERGARWVGKDTLRKPLKALQSGASLLLFPEGDTGPKEGELMPLTRGVGHFILLAPEGCPILPIALSGVQELYWRKPMTVIVGEPFYVRSEGLERHAAIEAAVNQVSAALRSLIPAYEEPIVGKKRLLFLTHLADNL
jgi:1-acyl-sn-glycerol-3-phosphate acyltransferase